MYPSDEALLIDRARHDPDSFAELYRHYLPRVYRYLYLRLGSGPDAEDLSSQVFIAVLEGLQGQRYRENGCFAAWLFTIVRRRLSAFRHRPPASVLTENLRSSSDVLDTIEAGDSLRQLSRLLAQLEPQKQELLRLRFAAELSFGEIAVLEKRSEAAVKMAFYRTLQWLREQWEADHE